MKISNLFAVEIICLTKRPYNMSDRLGTHARRKFKGQTSLKVLLKFSEIEKLSGDLFHFKDLSEFQALPINIWIYLLFTKNHANFSTKWAQISDM